MIGFVYGLLWILSFLFAFRAAYAIAKRWTKESESLRQKFVGSSLVILIICMVVVDLFIEIVATLLGVDDTFLVILAGVFAIPLILVIPNRGVPKEIQEILQDDVSADAKGNPDLSKEE